MTNNIVTDEQLGGLSKRMHDLYSRVQKGGVDFGTTMDGLQILSEGKWFPGLTENKDKFEANPDHKLIEKWQKFYKKVFGESLDFSGIYIPKRPGKDWWLVIVAKGMTPQRLFGKCRDQFGGWKWTDKNLDEIVISDRTAKEGHYAIWVRARIEADEEFKNLSANQLKDQKHNGITLEERLVLELFHFWKTKKHLDIHNWTLCAGSRDSDGYVPRVFWGDDKLGVCRCDPGHASDFLRSREAVS